MLIEATSARSSLEWGASCWKNTPASVNAHVQLRHAHITFPSCYVESEVQSRVRRTRSSCCLLSDLLAFPADDSCGLKHTLNVISWFKGQFVLFFCQNRSVLEKHFVLVQNQTPIEILRNSCIVFCHSCFHAKRRYSIHGRCLPFFN